MISFGERLSRWACVLGTSIRKVDAMNTTLKAAITFLLFAVLMVGCWYVLAGGLAQESQQVQPMRDFTAPLSS